MLHSKQSGRSMIEMLGVLAVIGVLSIGGMAGYSKAMINHKIGKTIEQIVEIHAKMSAYGDQLPSYEGLNNRAALVAKLAPAGAPHSGNTITNPFGGNIVIKAASLAKGQNDNMAYSIEYDGIPEEACLSLATHNWAKGPNSALIGIAINGSDGLFQGCSGLLEENNSACVDKIPLGPGKVVDWCNKKNNNKILVKYF